MKTDWVAIDQPALSIQANLCDSSNKHEPLNKHHFARTDMYMSNISTRSCMSLELWLV